MKYSALVSVTVYTTIPVEAEDPTEAAQKITLQLASPDFLETCPPYEFDEYHVEIGPTTEDAKNMEIEEYNRRVTVFEHEAIAGWLAALGVPVGWTLSPGGNRG